MINYHKTDPEFMERFEHFAFDEVINEPGQQLDDVTRHMAILATLLGCQGTDMFRKELPCALDAGVTPVMAKEIVYQAVDYLGIGRVFPFLRITNEVLTDRGVKLPLEVRLRRPWKTGWKRALRRRPTSSGRRCWRPGKPGTSTAGSPPTASEITIPVPASLLPSGK